MSEFLTNAQKMWRRAESSSPNITVTPAPAESFPSDYDGNDDDDSRDNDNVDRNDEESIHGFEFLPVCTAQFF